MGDKNEETSPEVSEAAGCSKEVVLYSSPNKMLAMSGGGLPALQMSWDADWAW